MNQVYSENECERAHTLTTTTTGSKNSQKEAMLEGVVATRRTNGQTVCS